MQKFRMRLWSTQILRNEQEYEVYATTLLDAARLISDLQQAVCDNGAPLPLPDNMAPVYGGERLMYALEPNDIEGGDSGVDQLDDNGAFIAEISQELSDDLPDVDPTLRGFA